MAAADVGSAAGARASDRVELVDEDDRGRRGLRLLEEVANPGGAHADDHLDELRGRHLEEGDAGLARHGASQERLSGAGRTREQDSPWDPSPEPAVLLGIAQEIHDFAELRLGLVDPRDVRERHGLVGGLHTPGP